MALGAHATIFSSRPDFPSLWMKNKDEKSGQYAALLFAFLLIYCVVDGHGHQIQL